MVARAGRQDRPQDDPGAPGKGVLILRGVPRILLSLAALAVLAAYSRLAVEVGRARTDPERFLGRGSARSAVGPPARSWNAAAEARAEEGFRVLNDTSREASDRLRGYRAGLASAEKLLVASLAAQPAQARTLAQLAAIRWEIAPSEEGAFEQLAMIEAASAMAPRVPRVQLEDGTLLLRMGRRNDAEVHLRRAVELEPALTDEVVLRLRESFYSAEEILHVLPPVGTTLIALRESFTEDGELDAYLEALEPALARPEPRLLSVYADACLAAGDPARLVARLDALAPAPDAALEAERRIQRARALAALGDPSGAVRVARDAAALVPEDARLASLRGEVALGAGDAGEALEAFRSALGIAARRDAPARFRARLYRDIGRSEEKLGDPGRAYDAYRRALELDPEEPFAGRRVSEMRKAAGMPSLP